MAVGQFGCFLLGLGLNSTSIVVLMLVFFGVIGCSPSAPGELVSN
jgi:hypothetical protein